MNLETLFTDTSISAKEKTTIISEWLADRSLPIEELIAFAEQRKKDAEKATCIEAIEYVSKNNLELVTEPVFDFMIQQLTAKAPRIKWESAKVIGNSASLFKEKLASTLPPLIQNTSHTGTVVRWSAAYALGEILKTNPPFASDLIATMETLISNEEKNSIIKIYQQAIKKVK